MKIVDGTFDYRDPGYGRDSTCRVRVYERVNKISVVILTELAENKGASITNTAERAAQEVCKEYDLDPAATIFVEHYDHSGLDAGATFDYVEFDWHEGTAMRPRWRATTKGEIEQLIGESA